MNFGKPTQCLYNSITTPPFFKPSRLKNKNNLNNTGENISEAFIKLFFILLFVSFINVYNLNAQSQLGNLPVFTNPIGLQDFSSANFITNKYLTSSTTTRKLGLEFSNDGSKMYSIGFDDDLIIEYTLSIPYSVTTATRTYELNITANGQYPRGLAFSADGGKMFILSQGTKVIYAYNLTIPFDLSTAVIGTDSFDMSSYTSLSVEGVDFNPEGTRMYLTNSRTNSSSIEQFDLSTPFEIGTASYSGTKDISSRFSGSVYGITFGKGGTQMFIGQYSDGRVIEYRLSTAYDVSTASLTANNGNVFSLSTPTDIVFSTAFDKLFILRYGQSSVYEYTIGSMSLEFPENSTALVTDVDANDGDGGSSDIGITYSLVSGGDNDVFTIDSATGELSFFAAPDFETPLDNGANNTYNITIIATDDDGASQDNLLIEVTDIDEVAPTLVLVGDQDINTDQNNCFYSVQGTELDPTTATDDSGSLASLTYSLQKMTPNPNLIEENFDTGSWDINNFELGTNTGSVVNGTYKSDTSSRGTLRSIAEFTPTLSNSLYVSATLSFTGGEGIAFIGTRSTGEQPSSQFNSEPQGLNLRIHNFNDGQTSTSVGYDFQPRPGNAFYNNPVRFQIMDDGSSMSVTMTNLVTFVSHSFSYNTNYTTGSNKIVFSGDNAASWDDIKISLGPHETLQEYANGSDSSIGEILNIGEHTMTWTVTDGSGNTATATQTVTVVDNIDPTITVTDITVNVDADSCEATGVDLGTATTADNCSVDSATNDAPTSFPLGDTLVTWTVTDGSGNIATTLQTIKVVDDIAPIVITQDVMVELDANGIASISANDIDNGSSDNCNIDVISLNITTFDCSNIGENTVTLTVSSPIPTLSDGIYANLKHTNSQVFLGTHFNDAYAGHTKTHFRIEKISDTETSLNHNDIVNLYSPEKGLYLVGSREGSTNMMKWTSAPGENASFILEKEDQSNMNIGYGDGFRLKYYWDSDNDGVSEVWYYKSSGTYSYAYTTTSQVQATVLSFTEFFEGYSSSNTAIVTVVDNIDPTITITDLTVNVDADSCEATGVDLGAATTADNCSVDSTTNDAPTSFPLGDTVVTWTVTDGSGNTATATQMVTVVDNIDPVAIAQDITVSVGDNPFIEITEADVDNGSSDNCSIASITFDVTQFDCSMFGDNTVTMTVTDTSGNSASTTFTVTVTNCDADDDNDGTLDTADAFPLDPTEDTDTDNDGTGDNADTDDDNDGTLDTADAFPLDPTEDTDTDNDGTGDNADTDDDNDGTLDTADDFPLDPTEDTDTDDDGTGDNADTDDDADGQSDENEIDCGSDPLEASSTSPDADNDSIPDCADNDYEIEEEEEEEESIVCAQAITPNGDNINDSWIIMGIENHPTAVITVYNKSGHEVFKTINYKNDWDGTFKSRSEKLPQGSYYFVINRGNGKAPVNGWIFINY